MSHSDNDIRVMQARLESVARRRRLFTRLFRLMHGAWVLLALLLTIIVIDAVWPLHESLRVTLACAVGVVFVAILWRSRLSRWDARRERLREARRLEKHFDLRSNPIVNALWLQPAMQANTGDLTTTLANRCVERGSNVVRELDVDQVIDRRPLREPTQWLCVVAGAWIVLTVWQPPLILGGLARLFDPYGDHPPFSLTRFNVAVDPDPVKHGHNANVMATLTGKVPERAELVRVDEQGREIRRLAMSQREAGQFDRRLLKLTEPMILQIEARGSRSKRFRIEPVVEPPKPEPQRTAENPEPSPAEAQQQPESNGSVTRDASYEEREMIARLLELIEAANLLQQEALTLEQLLAQLQSGEIPDWLRDRLGQCNSQLEGFCRSAGMIAGNKTGRGSGAGSGSGWSSMDGGSGYLGTGGASPLAQQLAALASALQSYNQQGRMNTRDIAAAARWLRDVRQAAAKDEKRLRDLVREQQLPSTSNPDQPVLPSLRPQPPSVLGSYDELQPMTQTPPTPMQAIMQQTPQAYRELVGQYFQRIAQDE